MKEINIFARGKVLRIASGIILALVLLTSSASALYDSEAKSFLGLINDFRAENNVNKLSIDTNLQNATNWMTDDMLNSCLAGRYSCSHTDSKGRRFDVRLRDFGYPAGVKASAGENIAWGYNGGASTAQQVFNLWKKSPGHRANMLRSSYIAIGISRSCSGKDCAWVTDFGSKIINL